MQKTRMVAVLGALALIATMASAVQPASGTAGEDRKVRTTKSGLVIQTVTKGGVTVTTYGVAAPKVTMKKSGKSSVVSAASPSRAAEKRARAGDEVAPTVYEMSLASGMTPDEACEFATGFDERGCVTSTQIEAKAPAKAPAAAEPAARPIHSSWCIDHKVTPGDGTKYAHGCTIRYAGGHSANYNFVNAKMKSTGWEEDGGACCDFIQGVGIQLKYAHSASTAVDWAPFATRDIKDSCKTQTTSVTSPQGVSISQSDTICPERLSPWHSPAFQYFGAKWTGPGAPHEHRRGVIAASSQRIPRGGSWNASLSSWLKWG